MKGLLSFLIIFQLIVVPVNRAYAIAPVVAGAAYALDFAAPQVLRYIGSEVIFQTITRGMDTVDAYYSAQSKVSNSRFASFIRSKAGLGNAVAGTILAGLGYYYSNGTFVEEVPITYAEYDVPPQQGFYWKVGSSVGNSISEAASKYFGAAISQGATIIVKPYTADPSLDHARTVEVISSGGSTMYEQSAIRSNCAYSSGGSSLATCQATYVPPSSVTQAVSDSVVQESLEQSITDSNLSNSEVSQLVLNNDGELDAELAGVLTSDPVPSMPNSDVLIPNQGDQLWYWAHQIATGVAQSDDSNIGTYVPSSSWDTAYYLADTVANSNTDITGLNASTYTASTDTTNTDTGTSTGTGTNTGATTGNGDTTLEIPAASTITIQLSGVESRLDTSNQITQNILDEMTSAQAPNTITQPDASKASSFWTTQYPQGISGVFSTFINAVLATPIFAWLNSFSLGLGTASEPVFELCFGNIAGIEFGCYSLSADSYVWSAIRAMMIASSLFVARRIVFGG